MNLQDAGLLRLQSFVDGRWVDADHGQGFAVRNPADGAVLADVADCGAAETQRAILAAEAAWPAWRAKPARSVLWYCAAGTS